MMKKIKNFPHHLILMAIFPIVSLYAHNIEQVAFASTIRAYVFFLSIALISFAIAAFIIRKSYEAALLVSFGLFLFYLVIPFQAFLIDKGIESFSRVRFLLPIFCLVFTAGAWWLIKRIESSERLTRIFNLMALSTLILPFFQISLYEVTIIPSSVNQISPLPLVGNTPPDANDAKAFPDVYFIVLDTHGRSDEIKSDFGYDNTKTLEQLTEMGFYIAECSNANYPDGTLQSMFATLNMKFMDHEKIKTQSAIQTKSEWFDGIKHNEVLNNFKQFGYKYVSFNTQYDFLNFTDADVYYDLVRFPGTRIRHFNKFESLLLSEMPIGLQINTKQRVHYENVLSVLTVLPQIPREVSSPKFIYAHIMVPHDPYVFSSTGEYLADGQDEFTAQKYVDQVAFIDEQIVAVAKQIVENSTTPPIILIQGDHGFYSKRTGNRTSGIINAYYLPGVNYSEYLYPTISPINSFRLIFNLYFDGSMSLLPDEVYRDVLGNERNDSDLMPYDFFQNNVKNNCLNGE